MNCTIIFDPDDQEAAEKAMREVIELAKDGQRTLISANCATSTTKPNGLQFTIMCYDATKYVEAMHEKMSSLADNANELIVKVFREK